MTNDLPMLVSKESLERASVVPKWSHWPPYWKVKFNTLKFHWGVLFPLVIAWMLWILSMRLNNRAAIVNKKSSQYNFFGSHIGRLVVIWNHWLQRFGSKTNSRSSLNFEISGILNGVWRESSALIIDASVLVIGVCCGRATTRCLIEFKALKGNYLWFSHAWSPISPKINL